MKLQRSCPIKEHFYRSVIGPPSSAKFYLMFNSSSRLPDRKIYIITKSRPESKSKSKNNIKELGDGIKSLNEYGNSVIVFDGSLGSSNYKKH